MNLCLTLDTDWAPPEVTDFALGLLRQAGVAYTLFVTEDQQVEREAVPEIAWHPNFKDQDPEALLRLFAGRFPGVAGLRPHRLQSSHLPLSLLRQFGLRWVSRSAKEGEVMPLWPYAGVPDFPITWGDNLWIREKKRPDLDLLKGSRAGFAVLNFHPTHLFLDTEVWSRYEAARPDYHHVDRLRRHVNEGGGGVRECLRAVLALASWPGVRFMTLSEACDVCMKWE